MFTFGLTRFCYGHFTDDADNTIAVVKKASKGRSAKKTAAAPPTPVGPEDVCSAVKPPTKRATVRGKVSSLAKLAAVETNEGSDEAAHVAEAEAKPAERVSAIIRCNIGYLTNLEVLSFVYSMLILVEHSVILNCYCHCVVCSITEISYYGGVVA